MERKTQCVITGVNSTISSLLFSFPIPLYPTRNESTQVTQKNHNISYCNKPGESYKQVSNIRNESGKLKEIWVINIKDVIFSRGGERCGATSHTGFSGVQTWMFLLTPIHPRSRHFRLTSWMPFAGFRQLWGKKRIPEVSSVLTEKWWQLYSEERVSVIICMHVCQCVSK